MTNKSSTLLLLTLCLASFAVFSTAQPTACRLCFRNDPGFLTRPGTIVTSDGVVRLDTTRPEETPGGTSLGNHPSLSIPNVNENTELTFQYKLDSGSCGDGQPRIAIRIDGQSQVYQYTAAIATPSCGSAIAGSDYLQVTIKLGDDESNFFPSTGNHIVTALGVIFDNPSDRGVAYIKDVYVGNAKVDLQPSCYEFFPGYPIYNPDAYDFKFMQLDIANSAANCYCSQLTFKEDEFAGNSLKFVVNEADVKDRYCRSVLSWITTCSIEAADLS